MIRLMLELLAAPALVAGSTLACRRYGAQIGGVLAAFPGVVGPVLLIAELERGDHYTVRVATGTLLGLVGLSGFVLAYARIASRARWVTSLGAAWACAALVAGLTGVVGNDVHVPIAFAAATVALTVAYRAMPPLTGRGGWAAPEANSRDLAMRMIVTALLVVFTTATADVMGPLIGGMVAGLPVLASVLAVFTHRRQGHAALVDMLRGMLAGMAGFVGFCVVIAALIVPTGTAVAFVVATLVAVALQGVSLKGETLLARRASAPTTAGRA